MNANRWAVTRRDLCQYESGPCLSVKQIYKVRPVAELQGFPDWETIGFPLSFHATELGAKRAMNRRIRQEVGK